MIVLTTELGILQRILDTVSLTLDQWLICIGASLVILVVTEVRKLLGIKTTEPAVLANVAPVPAAA